MNVDELIKIAKSKLNFGDRFIALRDTEGWETARDIGYNRKNGKSGSDFRYDKTRDILYVLGYGRYVVYEKGKWFDDVEPIYEVY